jgi:putative flippase GtrA
LVPNRSFAIPSKQFVLFLLTGGTAAVVNFCSRVLYTCWMDFSVAVAVAYLTGMTTAFILAKLFVFKNSQQQIRRSVWMFSLVNLIAVAQTWAISLGLVHILPLIGFTQFINEISHGIGIVIPVFTSYIGHKHWSFR